MTKKNILFLYPKFPDDDLFWNLKDIVYRYLGKQACFSPAGPATVIAMLPKEWDIRLVDLNVEELKNEDIAWADFVFVSAMLMQDKSLREVVQRCHALGKKVVAGGPFTTAYDKYPEIDHFVIGEAENIINRIVNDLEKGKLKRVYRAETWPDITTSPSQAWWAVNFCYYASVGIQFTRGCPFDCEFCDVVELNGRCPRTKTVQQIIDELNALYLAGYRGSVMFYDDNFIGVKSKAKRLLKAIIKWQKHRDYPFVFNTQCSINLADDDELLYLMVSANFDAVFLGIETINVLSLKETKKKQNVDRDLLESVVKIQKAGLHAESGFIVGFDNDRKDIFARMTHFIQAAGIPIAMAGILLALPKTKLWHRLKRENRLLSESFGDSTNIILNFIPKMSAETLLSGYKKMMGRIYSPSYYYWRIARLIEVIQPRKKTRLSPDHMMAFFRAIWYIGIKSKARRYFWPLMFITLMTNGKALPLAIMLAIYGEHFMKVVEKIKGS